MLYLKICYAIVVMAMTLSEIFSTVNLIYIIYIMRRFFTELRNSRSKPIRVARMDLRHVRKSE